MDTLRDRPADEIEVTEEMYDAGLEELQNGYLGEGVYDLTEPRLAAVYRAMASARPEAVRTTRTAAKCAD